MFTYRKILKEHRAYSDKRKCVDDDLLFLCNNCDPIIQRECYWSSFAAAWDEAKLGVYQSVPEHDVVLCRVCDELSMLQQGKP